MAGHSKWANIQHRKNRQDKKRGKIFTKLIRELTIAAKLGGSDPDANPRLRAAISNTKSHSLPKDAMERAIKRGAGGGEGSNVEEARYEGYGPGGVAILVDTITDNKKRTVAEVRHAFSKYGGNLGATGSVLYLFSKIGVLTYPAATDEAVLMEAALEGGAEDVIVNDDGSMDVLTAVDDFAAVTETLVAAVREPTDAAITMRATTLTVLDHETALILINLVALLEDLDDVQQVYTNADISDTVCVKLRQVLS